MKLILAIIIGLSVVSLSSNLLAQNETEITEKEKIQLLTQAYLYGYPLLTMDYTFKVTTNTVSPDPKKGRAPINQVASLYPYPKAGANAVVRPNLDTYYNLVYANLNNNPLYIEIPETKRYYLIPVLNAYTDVIETLGSRTTGQKKLKIALVGPYYNGKIDDDLILIQSNTSLNWLLGRVQVDSDEDGKEEVKNFYNKMIVKPLSERNNKNYTHPKGHFDNKNNFIPMKAVDDLDITEYFNRMMELLVTNPPQKADREFFQKLKKIGIAPGGKFDINQFSTQEQTLIKNIPSMVMKGFKMKTEKPDLSLLQNGWSVVTSGLGEYGTDYALRAYITKIGFGANLAKDALYPNSAKDSKGEKYNGANKYILHFDADKLPPVYGFWSITLYSTDGFLVENKINRYNLGSAKDLQYNKDGSLDIYIQNETPKGYESNWLPTPPAGKEFELTFRLYWPKEQVLNRTWKMPGVIKQ